MPIKIDPNQIPVYIELGGEIISAGKHAIETIAALFGLSDAEVADLRAKLSADEANLVALVAHLRERVPE